MDNRWTTVYCDGEFTTLEQFADGSYHVFIYRDGYSEFVSNEVSRDDPSVVKIFLHNDFNVANRMYSVVTRAVEATRGFCPTLP